MRRLHLAAGTAIALALGAPAHADYAAGIESYRAQNYGNAYQEFRDLALSGDPRAQYMLGLMYAQGSGVNQDFVRAHAWYNLSASAGNDSAAAARDKLTARMSAEQVATAQRTANEMRAGRTSVSSSASASSSGGSSATAGATASAPPYSVRAAQGALNQLGYSAGAADGVMGPNTRGAIRTYQADKGLAATGELTRDLYARMAADAYGASASSSSGDAGGAEDNMLAQLGYNVRNAQYLLNLLRYDAGPVDGVMGPKTRGSILSYQADHDLPRTGELSQRVFEHIQATVVASADGTGGDGGNQPKSSQLVADIQSSLRQRGYDIAAVTGGMDAQTEAAIRAYQGDAGLSADGVADRELLAQLQAGGSSRPDRDLVQDLQQELNERGYDAGPEDGVMGPRTRSAIRTYQSDSGQPVTGQVSQNLLAGLQSASQDNEDADRRARRQARIVQAIEEELASRGYQPGAVDGQVDARTRAAVRDFQADAGIAVDGEPNRDLLRYMRNEGAQVTANATVTPSDAAGAFVRGITGSILNTMNRNDRDASRSE